MCHSTKVLSERLTASVFPSNAEQNALFAHLALAQRLVCMDPNDLAKMPNEILLKADNALANAGDWLSAWQQIIDFATQRIRTSMPDNVIVFARRYPPPS